MSDDTKSTVDVEPAFVRLAECKHPAMVTHTSPQPWAPKGEIRYLPCSICRAVQLERTLALVAMHATGRCHCKKADDCHAIINEAIEDEKVGDAGIRADAIQECMDTIVRTGLQWSVRSELKNIPIVAAVDEVYAAVSKLKEIE